MDNRKKQVLEELEKQNGIISAACNNVGLQRSTFYLWMKDDPEFKAAVDEINEVAIDYVESKLFEKIEGIMVSNGQDEAYKVPPSDTAIIFYLKTKGKKRGYIERQEIESNVNISSAIIDWSEDNQTDTEADRG